MGWRVARSLEKLLAQVNAAHPGRDRRSDGAIGDEAHASSVSDHNPDPWGIVRARDFTDDDLAPGMDAGALASQLLRGRDSRIKYVICERRIFAGAGGPSPWIWRTYKGSDPHTSHVHVSVVSSAIADTAKPWVLPTAAVPTFPGACRQGSTGEIVRRVQQRLRDRGWTISVDASFGGATDKVVRAFQHEKGLDVDGAVGRLTWARLWTP